MNVFVWILQALLAFLYIAGGAYKLASPADLAAWMPAMSGGAWRSLGVVEIVCALLLVFPAALRLKPALTPLAAALLAVETLALAAFYARYSLAITPKNPMVWALVQGALAAFVAWQRFKPGPVA